MHYGTKKKLAEVGIGTSGKYAVQLKQADYEEYDYLLGMDSWNIKNMMRIVGTDSENKICRLLDFSNAPRDIADPWYTGNFEETYRDVCEGCEVLFQHILQK